MFKYEQVGRCYKVSCATGYCETIPSGFDTDYNNYSIYYFLDYGDEYPQGGIACGKPKCKSGYTNVSGTSGTPDSDYFDYVSGNCNGSTAICAKCKNSGTSGTSKSFGGLTCYKPSSDSNQCVMTASCTGLKTPAQQSTTYTAYLTCKVTANVTQSVELSGIISSCSALLYCPDTFTDLRDTSREVGIKQWQYTLGTNNITLNLNTASTGYYCKSGKYPYVSSIICKTTASGCTANISGL